MREQRKLAAVLAADVVGYSRLMGRDEAGTLAGLKQHRAERLEPALTRNGGRLVKLTGDGALAEFPSAVDALRAAIEFQQAVDQANAALPEERRIVFRVGLHVGDLIVDGDDLYGDGVNVAARLEGEAPPGGIVVSGALQEAVAGKLQAEFVDLGRLSLKNIDRQVQAYRVEWNEGRQQSPISTGAATSLALPEKPSIAVLPFQNMSGDPEQEYFTDGITDDIITELSRFRELFVIARNSSFTYKGKAVDIKQIGHELGVRYVLEGSIRRASNRIRITGQLIEAETGTHVWAERYDRVVEDVFDVQGEVTRAIASALAPEIAASEYTRAQRRKPESIGAYEIAVRAWADAQDANQTSDRTKFENAVEGARRALAIDPNNVLAWQALCFARGMQGWHPLVSDVDLAYRESVEAAERALALDHANARSHALKAFCPFMARDYERQTDALEGARRAVALNVNDTFVLYLAANLESSIGDAELAIDQCQQILRLNPRDSRIHLIFTLLAFTCFGARRYAEGVTWALRAINDAPRSAPAHSNLITCLVGMGEIDRAKSTFRKTQELFPALVARNLAGKGSHARAEVRARAALFAKIAAGLEDPSAAQAVR